MHHRPSTSNASFEERWRASRAKMCDYDHTDGLLIIAPILGPELTPLYLAQISHDENFARAPSPKVNPTLCQECCCEGINTLWAFSLVEVVKKSKEWRVTGKVTVPESSPTNRLFRCRTTVPESMESKARGYFVNFQVDISSLFPDILLIIADQLGSLSCLKFDPLLDLRDQFHRLNVHHFRPSMSIWLVTSYPILQGLISGPHVLGKLSTPSKHWKSTNSGYYPTNWAAKVFTGAFIV